MFQVKFNRMYNSPIVCYKKIEDANRMKLKINYTTKTALCNLTTLLILFIDSRIALTSDKEGKDII